MFSNFDTIIYDRYYSLLLSAKILFLLFDNESIFIN
jgi:hypothetical protein